ncbi:MAG: fasciclin domain-containing protein [Acidimicrobiales bacterium]
MSRIRPTRIVALLAALVIVAAACGEADEPAVITSGNNPITAPRDIVDTAVNAELTTLVAAIDAAGLEETLRGEGPFTVFAPTEAAFGALPEGLLELLVEPQNSGLLTDILTHHVVDGLQLSTDLLDAGATPTLEGSTIEVEIVEIPAADDDAESTSEVRINGDEAVVATPDQLATNGVVHLIDSVLIPSDRVDELNELISQIPEEGDIVATAEEAGNFTQLLAALDAAGLTETLGGDGNFTVFAPTDAAFAALSPDQLALLENPEVLEAVLLFHVVRPDIRTEDVLTERYLTTLEGQGARFSTLAGQVSFAGVSISVSDISATNGVIHVVDEVLIPDSVRGPGGF